MGDVAEPLIPLPAEPIVLPPSMRPEPPRYGAEPARRGAEPRIYAGPRTQAAADWLDLVEADHGRLARAGAGNLLDAIDTRRFQLTVIPGAPALSIAFHAGGRRTAAAQIRRDTAVVELALDTLAEVLEEPRAAARLAARLEALAPAWFRWTEADGGLPGLELAACVDEETAHGVAALFDVVLVDVLRRLSSVRRFGAEPR